MNWRSKYSTIIAIAAALFLLEACKKGMSPCETSKDGENYTLSDSAQTYIHHYTDANRIIFKTAQGSDIAFEVDTQLTLLAYEVPVTCEEDASQNQTAKGTSQMMFASLSNSAILNAPIFINLVEYPKIKNSEAYETLVVSYGALFSNSFEGAEDLFYYYISGDNPQIQFSDSLVVGGKTFYAVYEMNNSLFVPNLKIKYTMNQGVIYIKDAETGVEYVYDRKE